MALGWLALEFPTARSCRHGGRVDVPILIFSLHAACCRRSDKKKLVTYAQFLLGSRRFLLWYLTVTGGDRCVADRLHLRRGHRSVEIPAVRQ